MAKCKECGKDSGDKWFWLYMIAWLGFMLFLFGVFAVLLFIQVFFL